MPSSDSGALVVAPDEAHLPLVTHGSPTGAPPSHPHPFRWVVLLLFCSLSAGNALLWISLSSTHNKIMERYHLSDVAVNMLPATFYLLYLPGAMFAVWILHTKGLAFGIKLAAIGNAVGALVRIGGLDTRTGYWWLLFGNCIAALIQPLLLASPTKITAAWFPASEFTLSTSIGVVFNQLGIAMGFVLSATVATSVQDLDRYLIGISVAVCVFSILTWIFFRGEAPSPPSSAASQSTSSANVTIWREIYDLLRSWPFWILLFVFGSFTGGFWVLATFFDQILSPLGYDEETIAVCGIVFLAAGVPGMLAVGVVTDRFHSYKFSTITCGIFSVGGLGWMTLVADPDHLEQLLGAAILTGFFFAASQPVCLQAAVEVTFPLSEGISSQIMMTVAQFFSLMYTYAGTALQSSDRRMTGALILLTGGFLCATLLFVLFFQPPFWRPGHYRRHQLVLSSSPVEGVHPKSVNSIDSSGEEASPQGEEVTPAVQVVQPTTEDRVHELLWYGAPRPRSSKVADPLGSSFS